MGLFANFVLRRFQAVSRGDLPDEVVPREGDGVGRRVAEAMEIKKIELGRGCDSPAVEAYDVWMAASRAIGVCFLLLLKSRRRACGPIRSSKNTRRISTWERTRGRTPCLWTTNRNLLSTCMPSKS